MGHLLCDFERVKRFVNVHLHCIVSNLKRVSKMSTLPPPPWKNFCGRPCRVLYFFVACKTIWGASVPYTPHWFSNPISFPRPKARFALWRLIRISIPILCAVLQNEGLCSKTCVYCARMLVIPHPASGTRIIIPKLQRVFSDWMTHCV